MKLIRSLSILAAVAAFSVGALAQSAGGIGGNVTDSLGAIVVGATVTAVDSAGKQKQAISNARGEYSITGLAPGKYTVKAIAPKFALYENTEVDVSGGDRTELAVVLTVGGVDENVDVNTDSQVSTDPNENKNATILTEKELAALPDDPDELAAALQALAGGAAGPDGGQINIDGFTGGQMPPKDAIREVRINQNPFSAEYERIGFGRIDILTKPGFDKWRGSVGMNFNDESLNSRNPFAANRAPSQTRNFNGFLSGPIMSKKSSFFLDMHQGSNDQNAVVAADVLTASGAMTRFQQDVRVPNRRFSFSPRIDYAINDTNTLIGRYRFSRNRSENQGIGGFMLPSRAIESASTQHEIQLTESMIINSKTVNETRFQFEQNERRANGTTTGAGLIVSGAFNGGGSQTGTNYNRSKRWEITNATTTSLGKGNVHSIKFGIRVRGINIEDRSDNNYGGTFLFSGFAAPGGDGCDLNADLFVSSLEQYRCKLLGDPAARYNPNQFTLTAGEPVASVSQIDYSPYITDDWKVRQDLTLSFGLRYENQSNIKSNLNFAPRFGFAWSPGAGGARAPKTVFRGGAGVFFDRFNENQTLRARRQDGLTQLSYIVTNNPAILGQATFNADGTVSSVPTAAQLAAVTPLASIPYRIADDLTAPYSLQGAISVERQLTPTTVASATYIASKSLHTLRVRNVNAPVCPTLAACPAGLTSAQIQALRPDPTEGNIYRVESSGNARTQMLWLNLRTRLGSKISFNANYTLGSGSGDTDSLSSPRFVVNTIGFPAYSYDLSGENGPSAFLPRHQVGFFGSFQLPWGVRVNPFITASSGRRYNITTGVDTNYDSLFFERPTFAQLATRCTELKLTNSFCNMNGVSDPNAYIPRNYGKGPSFFSTNVNISKTFGFGGAEPGSADSDRGNRRGGGNRGGGNRRGGGVPNVVAAGGGHGVGMTGGMAGTTTRPYQLTVGVNIQNLFNTVNFNAPVSSLSSPSFGQIRSGGGSGFGFFGGGGSANRRIDLSLRFSF